MIPQSLGFITVRTPGTPVPLSATPLQLSSVRVQPRSAPGILNIGNVYLGARGMNRSTGAGVYAVLSPEQVEGFPLSPAVDLAQVYVDADNAGDGILGAYVSG
jgi:hypothetical protein